MRYGVDDGDGLADPLVVLLGALLGDAEVAGLAEPLGLLPPPLMWKCTVTMFETIFRLLVSLETLSGASPSTTNTSSSTSASLPHIDCWTNQVASAVS
jgi:hypothetical protein